MPILHLDASTKQLHRRRVLRRAHQGVDPGHRGCRPSEVCASHEPGHSVCKRRSPAGRGHIDGGPVSQKREQSRCAAIPGGQHRSCRLRPVEKENDLEIFVDENGPWDLRFGLHLSVAVTCFSANRNRSNRERRRCVPFDAL